MKVTEFAHALNHYFNDYLINDRSSSPKTIETYRYAFIQLIEYLEMQKDIKPENIKIQDVGSDNIKGMLCWLEDTKNVSVSTRNQRLAAFKSFASFVRYEKPEYIEETVRIQGIKQKKSFKNEMSYLKPDGIKLLLSQIDQSNRNGRRNYMMLTLMYTTGIRVSELIAIRGRDVSLNNPKTLVIYGKGNKTRHVPIVKQIAPLLGKYLKDNRCLLPEKLEDYIFKSHTGDKFTRQGVNYLISKYAKKSRKIEPALIPADCSPHKIRHSTAMSLVEEGVDLITIRDLLGHSSVQTTEIYAKMSAAKSRSAIEAASKEIVSKEDAIWETSSNIKDWLKGMTQRKIM
jgi:site-specific recombinase XerD